MKIEKKKNRLQSEKYFNRLMGRPVSYKDNYVRRILPKIVNYERRGGAHANKTDSEIFDKIFNYKNEDPEGELSEWVEALETVLRKEGIGNIGTDYKNAIIAEEIGDSLYNSYKIKGFKEKEIITISSILGFTKEQILDCIIIKTRSRLNNKRGRVSGKNHEVEMDLLSNYLHDKPAIPVTKVYEAKKMLEEMISKREMYRHEFFKEKNDPKMCLSKKYL